MPYVVFGGVVGLHIYVVVMGSLPLWTLIGTVVVIGLLVAALILISRPSRSLG